MHKEVLFEDKQVEVALWLRCVILRYLKRYLA